ncbi:MAG: DUF2207 domain-containing protein [Patescibacteria group bacterium]
MRQKILAIFAAVILFMAPHQVSARTNITEWYIKNFDTEIVVNTDSTLTITEKITADCGNLPDKHGIFRVLSTRNYKTKDVPFIRPIELISITDFNDQTYEYSTTSNSSEHTITWKIGSANKTVTGVNNYKIVYKVDNAIIFDNEKFDEFYWNINGAFWDMEIDKFTARVVFPAGVDKNNTEIYNYTGSFGSKDNSLVAYEWTDANTITYTATRGLAKKEGITTSVTFPKNIFTPPAVIPTEAQEMPSGDYSGIASLFAGLIGSLFVVGGILGIILPIVVFGICYYYWSKYGRDPVVNKTVIAQYEPPAKLNPMQLGFLYSHGNLSSTAITASIINLAVKKYITIKETETKFLFFKNKDYQLILNNGRPSEMSLDMSERMLLDYLFSGQKEVALSSLTNKFYKRIDDLKRHVQTELTEKRIFEKDGFKIQTYLYIGLLAIFFLSFLMPVLFISDFVCLIIILLFASWMAKLTPQGADYKWQTAGFKLFMQTAEKYRQAFNEKENIFEKFLPYAIVFGIVKQWAGKMAEIYGKDWETRYAPVWYTSMAGSAFNVSDFSNSISSLSSSMASTISSSPSSSGSGGGGSSGGGGGGGGGGGW